MTVRLTTMLNNETAAYYVRVCLAELDRHGVTVDTHLAHTYPDDTARFRAWAAESLLYAVRCTVSGDIKGALRGLLQVKEYSGRLGGFLFSPAAGDAVTAVQHEIEDRIAAAVAA